MMIENDRNIDELIEELCEEIAFKSFLVNKYCQKLHDMGSGRRSVLIDKVIRKYSDDKYVDKEYRLGRFPVRMLFNILYEYSIRYGKSIYDENADNGFCVDKRIVDGCYVVSVFLGQGTYIEVEHVDSEHQQEEILQQDNV